LSTLIADLSQIPGELADLITDGVFHGASGVLMSVVLHYPTLDFGAVGRAMPPGDLPTSSVYSDRGWS
jgi:hypothetical protein